MSEDLKELIEEKLVPEISFQDDRTGYRYRADEHDLRLGLAHLQDQLDGLLGIWQAGRGETKNQEGYWGYLRDELVTLAAHAIRIAREIE